MAHQMPVGLSTHRVWGLSTIISPGFMGDLGTGWEAEPCWAEAESRRISCKAGLASGGLGGDTAKV